MIPSPRSVTTRPPSPADDMDVSDDECPIPEMPSFCRRCSSSASAILLV